MAKLSEDAKKKYFDKITEYRKIVHAKLEQEKKILSVIRSGDTGANYKRLTLADDNLNIMSYFMLMNELSITLLGVKNEGFLNDARKALYKSIIYLEEIVTNQVDAPFSDYEEKLNTIESFDDLSRFELAKKLGFAVHTLMDAFGQNSKWKWSFVELEGRYTVVIKNLVNLKTIVSKLDLSIPGAAERKEFLELVKNMLRQTSARYREKYELSTQRIDDMKIGINLLAALKRFHILLGDGPEEVEMVKRKIDVWTTKMENDIKKKEEGQSGASPSQG